MVDQLISNRDRVVALWDKSAGGTANCIRYAEEKGRRVVNFWDQWEMLLEEGEDVARSGKLAGRIVLQFNQARRK